MVRPRGRQKGVRLRNRDETQRLNVRPRWQNRRTATLQPQYAAVVRNSTVVYTETQAQGPASASQPDHARPFQERRHLFQTNERDKARSGRRRINGGSVSPVQSSPIYPSKGQPCAPCLLPKIQGFAEVQRNARGTSQLAQLASTVPAAGAAAAAAAANPTGSFQDQRDG
ncbi:hypothetical protein V497_01156 [Pseudogymnoascus sp. VKM F-4516 (FW-969)]|nr:hypothetical protein V497_01156 [Pseudogymnoascus sp. VKM F-4516 (FW-969)]